MLVSYRNLLLISIPCLILIVVACIVRYSQIHTVPQLSWESWESTYEDIVKIDPDFFADEIAPTSTPKKVNTEPVITARSYLVGNVETGKIYISKNSTAVLPVASMSKLITAIAATDMYPATTTVTIDASEMVVATDTSMIYEGETFTILDMLFPLLLNSSNIAAEVLASTSDRIEFLELMSSYAWEIGMPKTFFADPSGISPRNISTAEDFFNLAKYLYKSRPDILEITRTTNISVASTTEHGAHNFFNIHPFVTFRNFIGGKTGHTEEARDTMLTIMQIKDEPIAIIVLGSEGRKRDTSMLISQIEKLVK